MSATPEAKAKGADVVMIPTPLVVWLHTWGLDPDNDDSEDLQAWYELDPAEQEQAFASAVRLKLARRSGREEGTNEQLYSMTDRGECAASVLFDIFGD